MELFTLMPLQGRYVMQQSSIWTVMEYKVTLLVLSRSGYVHRTLSQIGGGIGAQYQLTIKQFLLTSEIYFSLVIKEM